MSGRIAGWLLALAAMLPVPALADVTARYGSDSRSFEVFADDGGDMRINLGTAGTAVLRRGGVDYVVAKDGDGELVAALASDGLATLLGVPADEKITGFRFSRLGDGTAAGYSGTRWTFGPEGDKQIQVMLSPDPALKPVGDTLRWLVALCAAQFPAGDTRRVIFDQAELLFANGTVVRIAPDVAIDGPPLAIELISLSADPIDPARFALPRPLLSADDFRERTRPASDRVTVID